MAARRNQLSGSETRAINKTRVFRKSVRAVSVSVGSVPRSLLRRCRGAWWQRRKRNAIDQSGCHCAEMRIVETRRQAAALPVHTAMLESLSCLSSHMPFVSATLGLMLSAILQSVSPALITEEVEHLLVDLLRNVEHTPTAPFLHAGGKRVNVLMGTTAMFDFQENFSFAPLFSILSPQQAVRLSALIIAYAYDPRDIYVHFLCNQATASGLPFLDVLEAIQLGFRFALIRRAARIIALHELLLEGRIEAVDSSCDVMQFMGIFGRLSKDVRENVLLKFACVNSPIPDKGEKAVCFDTARVWMRCEVLQRRNGEIFVHYENWTDK